jgi:hypothetical protein
MMTHNATAALGNYQSQLPTSYASKLPHRTSALSLPIVFRLQS